MVDQKQSVSLMGLMGSGKSTLGRRLAENLGYDFIDLDKHIEESIGLTIPEIFHQQSESKFRKFEREALIKTTSKSKCIIALGGGTPCFLDNISVIHSNTFSIYLKVSVDEIKRRVSRSKTIRPLAQGQDDTELVETIRNQLEKREPYYQQADLVIESDHTDLAQVIKFLELAGYL